MKAVEGVPCATVILVFAETVLRSCRSRHDYNVQSDTILHILVHLFESTRGERRLEIPCCLLEKTEK